ncbi:Smr/MutS family protein [Wenzhouxiangella sp. XN201]|uniref:Smr/MutS family protein n=1 Tax=Wenzhouxiangella sp. XN201 TaxID=2710755 RepID=UPI0013C85832|nr:Smr/MutS family protein [Wenzhouxiangella sp. XN201]NEZ04282.1 Smr/MutS family protein [Wenzhouxiangella sp. XN201]
MAKLKLDLHDIYNRGNAIDQELERVIHEAVDKRIREVEIIPGRGSGQLKKRVLKLGACITHLPPTAPAQSHALSAFHSVGVLDVVATTPARSSVAKSTHGAPLNRLATEAGEQCRLKRARTSSSSITAWTRTRRIRGACSCISGSD